MKSIIIDDIKITVCKNALAKKISISVRPFKPVRVTIPNYLSYIYAERFAKEKIDWLKSTLAKIKIIEEKQTALNDQKEIKTKFHQLLLIPNESDIISVRLYQGKIKIRYPNHLEKKSEFVQHAIKKGIILALKKEGADYLPARVDELSKKFQLTYNNLSLKNIKSRWGSCSSRNNINLSIHLMNLPYHLIDYVILHELAHTIVKNHSRKYWNLLDRLTGNAKLLDKELKKYSLNV